MPAPVSGVSASATVSGAVRERAVPGRARRLLLPLPPLAALAIVCLTITLPRDTLFAGGLPLGPGSVKVTDALLAVALASWLASWKLGVRPLRLPSRPIGLALGAMMVLACVGVVTAHVRGVPANMALLELRQLLAFLVALPLIGCIDTRRWVWIAGALLAVASACASVAIIVLYLTGNGDQGTYTDGAIRVMAVPWVGPMFGAIAGLVLAPFARTMKELLFLVGLVALAVVGLYFTFQRTAFVAVCVGLVVALILAPAGRRARLGVALTAVVVLGLAGVLAFNAASSSGAANPLSSGAERIASIFRADSDVSSQHRVNEAREAWRQITAHPVTGLGLGATITFESPMYDPVENDMGFTETNHYLHNSYLWAALKMGVGGLLALAALLALTVILAIRGHRAASVPADRAALAVCTAVLLALIVASTAGPLVTVESSTALVGALVGIVEVVRRLAAATRAAV